MTRALNRWHAFAIHLFISAIIFAVLLCIILFLWYPKEFLHIGGIAGIKIVAGVDFVLGPVLTLIVFNATKKSLKWDLSAIAAVQFFALSAGVWLVYMERPKAQVISYDGVHVVTHSDFHRFQQDTLFLRDYPGKTPKVAVLKIPLKLPHILTIVVHAQQQGLPPLPNRIDLYSDPSALTDSDKNERMNKFDRDKTKDCWWMPVHSNHFSGSACFSYEKGITEIKHESQT